MSAGVSGQGAGGGGNSGSAGAASASGSSGVVGQLIFDERFDATAIGAVPAPFTSSAPDASVGVQPVPFLGNRSLRLAKPGTGADVQFSGRFAATSGKVVVEAKVKSEQLAGRKCAPCLLGADASRIVGVLFEDGMIRSWSGSTLAVVQPFVADTWYVVRVVVDTQAGTYDLYVDGVKVLVAQPVRTRAPAVAQVLFQIGQGQAGTMYVDSLRVYELGAFIGAPRGPVFDVKMYGAKGDGATKDTAAIQAAIDAAPASGGTVYLHDGTYITGTVVLKSNLTLYIDSSAVLKASPDVADFPTQVPKTANYNAVDCQRALVYAAEARNINIDGGGTIDGDGSKPLYHVVAGGSEGKRAIMLYTVHVTGLHVRNLYFKDGATWGVVPMECNDVEYKNIYIDTAYWANRDGIDVVDSDNVSILDSTFNTEDDAICPKSGIRKGVNNLHVSNVNITRSIHANGIKFGTVAYGGLKHALFEDVLLKNVAKGALNLESTDGADVSDVTFRRIEIDGSGNPFFLIIEDRGRTPAGDVRKVGSIDGVRFIDIRARGSKMAFGSLLVGFVQQGVTYPIKNISFDNVTVTHPGGGTAIPADPGEPTTGYPEVDMFNVLPAWGYYFRHVRGLTFLNTSSQALQADARPKARFEDVDGLIGVP